MNKIITRLTVVAALFVSATAFALPRSIDEYLYQSSVELKKILRESTQVSVSLSDSVLNHVKPNLSNILVLDDENNKIPFEIYYKNDFGLYNEFGVVSVSSGKGDPVDHLLDNDVFTEYRFDEKVDQRDPSSVVVDLGRIVPLSRIQVLADNRPPVRTIEVLGGASLTRMKPLLSKRKFSGNDFYIHSEGIQFLELRFWGIGVNIHDIKIYSGVEGQIAFEAEPERRYKVLYGGNPDYKAYSKQVYDPFTGYLERSLGIASLSLFLPEDIDGDSVLNEDDNCLSFKNKTQKDSDKDSIGDACDNAPYQKNHLQLDSDNDGIGNVVDNCVTRSNKKQIDRDKDGLGDECDSIQNDVIEAPDDTNKESDEKENQSRFIFNIILLLVVLAVTLYFLIQTKMVKLKKKKKNKGKSK